METSNGAADSQKAYTAARVADHVGGQLHGDPERIITGVAGIEDSEPQTVSFAENEKFLEKAEKSEAGVLLIPRDSRQCSRDVIRVDNPRLAYARAAELFSVRPYYRPGKSPEAVIDETAVLGEEVSVHPGVVIGPEAEIGDRVILAPGSFVGRGVKLGRDTTIHPRVVIERDTVIGKNVTVEAGTVIGSTGFGYVEDGENGYLRFPQQGRVVIEDDVDIGACVCIDRAASGETVIGAGTKIDNLVQIAHNVRTGEKCLITAQVGIAGSSTLGEKVTLAGQVGVVDHVHLGDGVLIGGKSMVSADTRGAGFYSGIPVQPHKKELRQQALVRKLPQLYKRIKELEKEIEKIKGEES